MRFDLHIHTHVHSGDSALDPMELVAKAREMGLDGIVITEHDYQWTEKELEELRAKAPGLVILAGVEVSAWGGDVLCYGVTDPLRVKRGMDWGELTREVHKQGGVAVAAHPWRWGQDFEKVLRASRATIDGIEMTSNNMDTSMKRNALAYRARHPHLAGLGNSDAHQRDTVGCFQTLFDVSVRTTADLVEAIRQGKASPVLPPEFE